MEFPYAQSPLSTRFRIPNVPLNYKGRKKQGCLGDESPNSISSTELDSNDGRPYRHGLTPKMHHRSERKFPPPVEIKSDPPFVVPNYSPSENSSCRGAYTTDIYHGTRYDHRLMRRRRNPEIDSLPWRKHVKDKYSMIVPLGDYCEATDITDSSSNREGYLYEDRHGYEHQQLRSKISTLPHHGSKKYFKLPMDPYVADDLGLARSRHSPTHVTGYRRTQREAKRVPRDEKPPWDIEWNSRHQEKECSRCEVYLDDAASVLPNRLAARITRVVGAQGKFQVLIQAYKALEKKRLNDVSLLEEAQTGLNDLQCALSRASKKCEYLRDSRTRSLFIGANIGDPDGLRLRASTSRGEHCAISPIENRSTGSYSSRIHHVEPRGSWRKSTSRMRSG